MALTDFMSKRTVLLRGGRRIVCRPPTVESFLRFESIFQREIESTLRVRRRLRSLGPDPVAELLPIFLQDLPRVASVLSSCVELWDGAPGDLEREIENDAGTAEAVALAVLQLCDVPRIASKFDEDLPRAPEDGPSLSEQALVKVAETFALDPAAIMAWPYEQFVTVADCLAVLHPPKDGAVATRHGIEGLGLPGIAMGGS